MLIAPPHALQNGGTLSGDRRPSTKGTVKNVVALWTSNLKAVAVLHHPPVGVPDYALPARSSAVKSTLTLVWKQEKPPLSRNQVVRVSVGMKVRGGRSNAERRATCRWSLPTTDAFRSQVARLAM
jgi:hypothetical protein